jgi:hypothetical protein
LALYSKKSKELSKKYLRYNQPIQRTFSPPPSFAKASEGKSAASKPLIFVLKEKNNKKW